MASLPNPNSFGFPVAPFPQAGFGLGQQSGFQGMSPMAMPNDLSRMFQNITSTTGPRLMLNSPLMVSPGSFQQSQIQMPQMGFAGAQSFGVQQQPGFMQPNLDMNFQSFGISDQLLQQRVNALSAMNPQGAQMFNNLQMQKYQILQRLPYFAPAAQAQAIQLFNGARALQANLLGFQLQQPVVPAGIPFAGIQQVPVSHYKPTNPKPAPSPAPVIKNIPSQEEEEDHDHSPPKQPVAKTYTVSKSTSSEYQGDHENEDEDKDYATPTVVSSNTNAAKTAATVNTRRKKDNDEDKAHQTSEGLTHKLDKASDQERKAALRVKRAKAKAKRKGGLLQKIKSAVTKHRK